MSGPAPSSNGAAVGEPFVHHTVVHFDDLDAMAMLHNGRYPLLAERAITAFFEHLGWQWRHDVSANPDQFHAVRDLHIEYLAPVRGMGPIDVEVVVEHLGTTSAAFGFTVRSAVGVHARGRRSIVKLDPETLRPTPWTDTFRDRVSPYFARAAA